MYSERIEQLCIKAVEACSSPEPILNAVDKDFQTAMLRSHHGSRPHTRHTGPLLELRKQQFFFPLDMPLEPAHKSRKRLPCRDRLLFEQALELVKESIEPPMIVAKESADCFHTSSF